MFYLKVYLKDGRIIKDPTSIIAGETPRVGTEIDHHIGDDLIKMRITNVWSPAPIPPSTLTIDEVDAIEI
jgi:hypothetical protein